MVPFFLVHRQDSDFSQKAFPLTYPSFFYTLCDHHDVVNILLPDHFPEIVLGAGQRSLSGNVLPTEVVALKEGRFELLETEVQKRETPNNWSQNDDVIVALTGM